MNELIPDKKAYQLNKRIMAYLAMAMMGIVTVATVVWPGQMAEADSILMAQYLALSGLVGAYFGFSAKSNSSTKIEAKS
ncbi:MAG: hypothetical protein CMA66_00890 [Euryarchaeota archaeon]|jgi:hypothetical protein|nr:hypothetical protein [Euryarchaeota archaeon]|tara:strand:- start:5030 stop:5266 length:237 start_codon:yes stop_codon:yes gene_type:complete